MEAQAFVESDIDKLIDCALGFIPKDCVIARLIGELRELHTTEPDWRKARAWLAAEYPYERFGGGCPMVPNHGLIILALLYGNSSFAESLMIVNTSGWDTDCNSGNVGCLLGIKDGLETLDADGIDWRGPVSDRLYIPTADAGAGVTDAVIETGKIVNMGRALAGLEPVAPKGGARFHFQFPDSAQGFAAEGAAIQSVESGAPPGVPSLAIHIRPTSLETPRAFTRTWARAEDFGVGGYRLAASPTLYAGQTLRARLVADPKNAEPVICRLHVEAIGKNGSFAGCAGPDVVLKPGGDAVTIWRVPDTKGAPIARVGLRLDGAERVRAIVYLDYLTWDGPPDTVLIPTADVGTAWQEAWVNGVDMLSFGRKGWALGCRQNRGTGLVIQGTREWTDYRVVATVKTDLSKSAGVAARVQGMRRYVALLLVQDGVRLVRVYDDETTLLAEADLDWHLGERHELALDVSGSRLRGFVDGRDVVNVRDDDARLCDGAVALIVEEGQLACESVTVTPVQGADL